MWEIYSGQLFVLFSLFQINYLHYSPFDHIFHRSVLLLDRILLEFLGNKGCNQMNATHGESLTCITRLYIFRSGMHDLYWYAFKFRSGMHDLYWYAFITNT